MSALSQSASSLEEVVSRLVPRLLSQICRDPGSSAHGACDRDWWHYKIRDFPSIILQQGGYTAWLAGDLEAFAPLRDGLRELARAACRFWNDRARRRGAFEEYYPWEEGYPPLAFSTLAVTKLVREGVIAPGDVDSGARIAARQLLERFEAEAANQQVAGLAALAFLQRTHPKLIPPSAFARLKERTLALQSSEGWFAEYGGPDLGYLSVTLDCLWDLHDATGDPAYSEAAGKALDFLAELVPSGGESIGMHNSRNTDYVLPYGIVRFLTRETTRAGAAASLFTRLYGGVTAPGHFIHALDDRYLCHYAGHSLVRACLELRRFSAGSVHGAPLPAPPRDSERLFDESGQFVRTTGEMMMLVSLKKGGVWSLRSSRAHAADFGWVATVGRRQFVSHWWSDAWKWRREPTGFRVEGPLVPHRDRSPSPLAHAALRVASFLFGRRIIGWLKRRLIFRVAESPYRFERRLVLAPERVEVRDRISGLPPQAQIRAAPRASKRHVASAGGFQREDLARLEAVVYEVASRRTVDGFEAEAVYRFDPLA
jgi:hypothetical protein